MKGETLFFGMSIELPLDEAVEFKKSLGTSERYYLLKVRERPGNVHRDPREGMSLFGILTKGNRFLEVSLVKIPSASKIAIPDYFRYFELCTS